MFEANIGSIVLPPSVQLSKADGGLDALEIRSRLAKALIYAHGAHVQEFHPVGQEHPVLFQSQKSFYATGKPIRGGVPLIFPWFGPHTSRPDLPAHGLVRTRPWKLEAVRELEDGTVVVEWSAHDSEETRAEWNHAYGLRFRITVGTSLSMELNVENRSAEAFDFEDALHTYLQVSDARTAIVRGLNGTEYIDKVDAMARKLEQADRIRIEAETDRIYLNMTATCYIDDPGYVRTLEIEKTGSQTTVLWNPWIRKAAAMEDFGDDEWPGMICIETANAADNSLRLEPGARHTMSATVRAHPLMNPA